MNTPGKPEAHQYISCTAVCLSTSTSIGEANLFLFVAEPKMELTLSRLCLGEEAIKLTVKGYSFYSRNIFFKVYNENKY